jgi:hypothetical protein
LRKPLISLGRALLLGSIISLTLSDKQKKKGKILFSKKQRERKICEEKELNKYLSFVNRRSITEDEERQLRAIN